MQARFDHFAVEQHRACTAFADDAADVRAGEADLLAQKMGQKNARLDILFVKATVNRHPNLLFHIAEHNGCMPEGSRKVRESFACSI